VWTFGSQDVTLGGHFSFQSGEAWARSESVGNIILTGNNARSAAVGLRMEPVGANGRRLDEFYQLNLSAAWGFPLGGTLRGNFRVEGLNMSDEQETLHVDGRGEVRPVRRDFMRPRQFRALFSIKL
jgi:hypothetical protein